MEKVGTALLPSLEMGKTLICCVCRKISRKVSIFFRKFIKRKYSKSLFNYIFKPKLTLIKDNENIDFLDEFNSLWKKKKNKTRSSEI